MLGQGTQDMGREIDRMDPRETTVAPSHRRPNRSDDHRITHDVDRTPGCHSETMPLQPWETSPSSVPAPVAGQPWRIKPVLPVTKGLGAVAVVVLALAFGREDPIQWGMATVVAIGLAVWALRDVIAPVRLAADRQGVTVVTGYAGRRHLPWAQVEGVRLDRRDRLGVSSVMIEIDADDALYLFSMHDLGTDPRDVLEALEKIRPQDGQVSSDSVR
jgi:hypothetical protein